MFSREMCNVLRGNSVADSACALAVTCHDGREKVRCIAKVVTSAESTRSLVCLVLVDVHFISVGNTVSYCSFSVLALTVRLALYSHFTLVACSSAFMKSKVY